MAEPTIGLWRVAARVYEHHYLRQRVHLVPSSQRIGLRGKSQQEMPGSRGSALTAPLRNTGLRGKRYRASGEVVSLRALRRALWSNPAFIRVRRFSQDRAGSEA